MKDTRKKVNDVLKHIVEDYNKEGLIITGIEVSVAPGLTPVLHIQYFCTNKKAMFSEVFKLEMLM